MKYVKSCGRVFENEMNFAQWVAWLAMQLTLKENWLEEARPQCWLREG